MDKSDERRKCTNLAQNFRTSTNKKTLRIMVWGAVIGAAASIAGSLIGGNSAAKAERRRRRAIQKQMDENKAWYDKNYNEDFTQRADAQVILQRTEENIRERNKAARARQAVLGGTEESVAADKEANNKALADATQSIAVAAQQRKDQIEATYQQNKNNLQAQLNDAQAAQAQNTATATSGILSAAGSVANALDSTAKDKQSDTKKN